MLLQAKISGLWVNLPTPAPENYSVEHIHLEDSFVNALGKLVRQIIRKNRLKVNCGWSALDGTEMALLQSLYTLDEFELRFTDNNNNRVDKIVYAGPLSGKAIFMNSTTYAISLRTDVQMNFIEV